jgi:hypothetical protein
VSFDFVACDGLILLIWDCPATYCSAENNQYIRLFNSSGTEIGDNDNGCQNGCSAYFFGASSECQTYTLKVGCYGTTRCNGQFKIEEL